MSNPDPGRRHRVHSTPSPPPHGPTTPLNDPFITCRSSLSSTASRRQVSPNQSRSRSPSVPSTTTQSSRVETLGGGGDGPGRAGEGVRRPLLRDVRHESRGAGVALPGEFHAHIRGRQDHGRRQHHQQAHLAALPAVPAHHRHRRLPALGAPGRRDRLRLRLHRHLPRGTAAAPQVLPGVPLDACWRELLCAE